MPELNTKAGRVEIVWPVPIALKGILVVGLGLFGCLGLWATLLTLRNTRSVKEAMGVGAITLICGMLAYASARLRILVVATPKHIFRIMRLPGCTLRTSRKHAATNCWAVVITPMNTPGKYVVQSDSLWAIEVMRRDRKSIPLVGLLSSKETAESFARPLAEMAGLPVEYAH